MANAARKTSFAVIPGVPGCTYYLTVKGKDRTLICTENRGNKVVLADLKSGYRYTWDVKHFSYMLRQHRWRDTAEGSMPKIEIEVTHKQGTVDAFRQREYTQDELNSLVDNIEDIEF